MFFKNYYNPGKGIDKNQPPQKGLSLYIDLIMIDFWGFIGLNMLYFIVSIPLITIGGATLAFNEICCRKINGDHIFVYSDFLESFKKNFKKGILAGIIIIIVIADLIILYTNAIMYINTIGGLNGTLLWSIALLTTILISSLMNYLIPIMANYNIVFLPQIKFSAILMVVGSWRTLVATTISIMTFVLAFTYFPFSAIIFFIFEIQN